MTVDARLRWSESDTDLDGFPAPTYALADTDDTTSSEQWSGFARLTARALGLDHQVSVSASDISRATVSAFPSVFDADRQVLRWQASGVSADSRIDYAFGAEHEDVSGALSSGLSEELSTTSAFATGRFQLSGRLTLSGGLRRDDTEDFGDATTGRLSAAYELGGGVILSGAVGTGFKTPTISQAVCDFCFSSEPFPVLRPEHADSREAALGWVSGDGRFQGRATVYRLEVQDQITYVTDPGFNSYYVNIAETRTDGVEVEGRAALPAGFDLSLAYAWTDAVDATDGSRLLRVPEHSGSVTLGWTGNRLSGALIVRGEGDMGGCRGRARRLRHGQCERGLGAERACQPDGADREPGRRALPAAAGLRRAGPQRLRGDQAALLTARGPAALSVAGSSRARADQSRSGAGAWAAARTARSSAAEATPTDTVSTPGSIRP